MKPLRHSLLILLAAALGLGLGLVLRPKASPQFADALQQPSASIPVTSRLPALPKPASVRAHDDSPLATQLERDLSMSRGVTRWLYWLEALEKAAPSDFPRLAQLAKGDATAARFVAARWVEVAPRHLFDTIVAASTNGGFYAYQDLALTLFQQWPRNDPDAAIAALESAVSFGSRHVWQMNVAGVITQQDPERGLALMAKWHIGNYGPHMDGVARWAAADPRHAAEFTLSVPAGFASELAMETIGKEWAKTDPAAALEFARNKPGELGSRLAAAALQTWAGRDLHQAADWLTSTDPGTRNRLSPAFVEVWAGQDAVSALAWCESNLTGSSLARAVGGALKGVADRDIAQAGALVAGMSPSPARIEAARAVARKWFPDHFSGKTVKPEAIAWLATLDPQSTKRVLEEIQWSWSTSDPQGMAAFLAMTDSDKLPQYTAGLVARQLARKDPLHALQWASQLPADRALDAGTQAFGDWRGMQPEQAMKWLNDLPSSDPRRQPFFEQALIGLSYDPRAEEQIAQMTAPDRLAARKLLPAMKLPPDRRARLLAMLAGQ